MLSLNGDFLVSVPEGCRVEGSGTRLQLGINVLAFN